MNVVTKYISYSTVIAGLFSMLYFWFTYFYPYEPVTLITPIEVTNSPVPLGGKVKIHMNFVKNMDITPSIKYYLVDSFIYQFGVDGVRRSVGSNDVVVEKQLPDNIPPGEYSIQVELSYPVHPWRSINYIWKTQKFDIVASDSARKN